MTSFCGLLCIVSMLLAVVSNTNVVSATSWKNMNGAYPDIANAKSFPTEYSKEKTEYFDVYSQVIKTLYSQVYWRMQDPVSLPESIINRFANGKVMAIVGYEADQVHRRTINGVEEDFSIPITWAYDHHYVATMTSENVTMVMKSDRSTSHSGHGQYWEPRLTHNDDDDRKQEFNRIPLAQVFSEGNGGEFRRSFHGYPKGYAQLIESPNTIFFNPMQIDTWNRAEMNGTKFVAGPLPKSSRIPPNAGFSGLIECPCSDRVKRKYWKSYALDIASSTLNDKDSVCFADISTSKDCFDAGQQLVFAAASDVSTEVIENADIPLGCTVMPTSDAHVRIMWNNHQQGNTLFSPSSPAETMMAFAHAKVNVTIQLNMDQQEAIITLVGPADRWFGIGLGTNSMCLHMEADECTHGGPYAIIVSQDVVTERKLDFHGPGRVLAPTVHVQSMTLNEEWNIQTVVLTRHMHGATGDHYTFDVEQGGIETALPIITARGCDHTFAKHCGHGPTQLQFLPVDIPTKICVAGMHGSVGGNVWPPHRCAPFPKSELERQGNPTCSPKTYRGGMACCLDGHFLLDKDQEIPWADQYLEYQLKFRFYFEEYTPPITTTVEERRDDGLMIVSSSSTPASHINLGRMYWQTEAHAGEYDILQCEDNTQPDQCIQVLTSRFQVSDMVAFCTPRTDGWCGGRGNREDAEGVYLVYAGPHCHAPACISMELYNADNGRLLCKVEPVYGNSDEELYDERGYLAIPPCIWGNEDGLPKPELLSFNTTLLSIKRNSNTLPHTGEMASWQMRGVIVPKKNQVANNLQQEVHILQESRKK